MFIVSNTFEAVVNSFRLLVMICCKMSYIQHSGLD